MDSTTWLFWITALLTAVSAVGVVVTQNIVRAAAWLLFALGGTAGIFFLLGADFVGATQLLVYVGGTLVLVVFGVMLTAQGPFISMKTNAPEWGLSVFVGLTLYGVIAYTVLRSGISTDLESEVRIQVPREGPPVDRREAAANPVPTPGASTTSEQLGEALMNVTEATPANRRLTSYPAGRQAPVRKPVGYLLPFEIVSVHLLVVLVGAAYLARAKRRRGAVP